MTVISRSSSYHGYRFMDTQLRLWQRLIITVVTMLAASYVIGLMWRASSVVSLRSPSGTYSSVLARRQNENAVRQRCLFGLRQQLGLAVRRRGNTHLIRLRAATLLGRFSQFGRVLLHADANRTHRSTAAYRCYAVPLSKVAFPLARKCLLLVG